MPALLTADDKAKIKRHVPQSSNKIITAGIAKLYVSFPDRSQWVDTGLAGAAVLAYDEVGKCFFFKLVDVIGNQGVLWDQELYDGFHYNQDRTFFHSFELVECMGAFSFADEREAGNFFSKVESRQKKVPGKSTGLGKKMRGLFGKVDKQEISSPRPDSMVQTMHGSYENGSFRASTANTLDPGMLDQLTAMGIREDQIAGNEEAIKAFILQKHAESAQAPVRAPAPPRPPAPAPPTIEVSEAPTITRSTPIRKLPPPVNASIQPMRQLSSNNSTSSSITPPEPSPRTSSEGLPRKAAAPPPPVSRSKQKGPPPPPARNSRQHSTTPEPPSYAPHIPSKLPISDDEDERPTRVFNVPPPFEGPRKSASLSSRAPPAIPSRNGPAVPARSNGPPQIPGRNAGPPPPTPARNEQSRSVPAPPSLPTSSSGPPPPPPGPPPRSSGPPGIPPINEQILTLAPPMPSSSNGPPPPPPSNGPPSASIPTPSLPGKEDLLASIRSTNAKKLRKTETIDKSGPLIPGAAPVAKHNTGTSAAPTDMASQLAQMLGERNKKVAVAAQSDDESDEDW